MRSPEELIGIIQGLTGDMKEQHTSSKEVISHTQQQIQNFRTRLIQYHYNKRGGGGGVEKSEENTVKSKIVLL